MRRETAVAYFWVGSLFYICLVSSTTVSPAQAVHQEMETVYYPGARDSGRSVPTQCIHPVVLPTQGRHAVDLINHFHQLETPDSPQRLTMSLL